MKRRTATIIVIASVVGLAAIGTGAWGVKTLVDNSFKINAAPAAAAAVVKTATSMPTPTGVPVGGVLDEQTALDLRREMPENGDYAYKLPDGRWIKINTMQPLPAEVTTVDEQKVTSALPATGTTIDAAVARAKGTTSAAGASQYATGKLTLVISLQAQGNGDGSGNHLVYKVLGAVQPGSEFARANEAGGWSNPDAALAAVQGVVGRSPDAAKYQVILVR